VGKFERLNRPAKDKLGLMIYASPEELLRAGVRFQRQYNHEQYHEALRNLRPGALSEAALTRF